jgi:hypothetical protein
MKRIGTIEIKSFQRSGIEPVDGMQVLHNGEIKKLYKKGDWFIVNDLENKGRGTNLTKVLDIQILVIEYEENSGRGGIHNVQSNPKPYREYDVKNVVIKYSLWKDIIENELYLTNNVTFEIVKCPIGDDMAVIIEEDKLYTREEVREILAKYWYENIYMDNMTEQNRNEFNKWIAINLK